MHLRPKSWTSDFSTSPVLMPQFGNGVDDIEILQGHRDQKFNIQEQDTLKLSKRSPSGPLNQPEPAATMQDGAVKSPSSV